MSDSPAQQWVPALQTPARKSRIFPRLAGCFALVWIAVLFGGWVNQGLFLWVANGVLLAYLLVAPRRRWPVYFAVALLAHLTVAPFIPGPWIPKLFHLPQDMIEAFIAALLLRRSAVDLPDFTNIFYLLRFALPP